MNHPIVELGSIVEFTMKKDLISVLLSEHKKYVEGLPDRGADGKTHSSLVMKMLKRLQVQTHLKCINELPKCLDPCAGTGTFIVGLFAMLREAYSKVHPIALFKDSIYACDIDMQKVEHLHAFFVKFLQGVNKELNSKYNDEEIKKIVTSNIVCFDSLTRKWNMKFDVVVGNPPYQNGKDKIYYRKFIKQSLKILNPSGTICMITPATLFTKKCNTFPHAPISLNILSSTQAFGQAIKTTDVAYWVYSNSSCLNTISVIDNEGVKEFEWPLDVSTRRISEFETRLLSKLTSRVAVWGRGQPQFVATADALHTYPVFLGNNRRQWWSPTSCPGQNINKLIVSFIFEPGRIHKFCERNIEKGVGRYAGYFAGSDVELDNIERYLSSACYHFVNMKMRIGRYAKLAIPDGNWHIPFEEWDTHFGLTQEEIDYIEKAVK